MRHHAVGADGGVIAHNNRAEKLGSGAYVDIIPNRRNARARAPAAYADGDLVGKVAVAANHGKFADDDAAFVPDVKARSNFSFIRNADAEADLLAVVNQPCQWKEESPQFSGAQKTHKRIHQVQR